MMRLKKIELLRDRVQSWDEYPFDVPCIGSLKHIDVRSRVCFFVGENGSGKSTLLEAIAAHYGFGREGGVATLRARRLEAFTATRNSSKSSGAMTHVRAARDVAFKNCCLKSGRFRWKRPRLLLAGEVYWGGFGRPECASRVTSKDDIVAFVSGRYNNDLYGT